MHALQDHDTVISVIDAVVAGKEMSSARSRRNEDRDGAEVTLGGSAFHARAPATGDARSPSDCHYSMEPVVFTTLRASVVFDLNPEIINVKPSKLRSALVACCTILIRSELRKAYP